MAEPAIPTGWARTQRAEDERAWGQTTAVRVNPGRAWKQLMMVRVLAAVAVLGLLLIPSDSARQPGNWLVLLAAGYAACTMVQCWLTPPAMRQRPYDRQWLAVSGMDLLYYGLLQLFHAGGNNYSALLIVPVLASAILGSRALALGTAALAALTLVASLLSAPEGIQWPADWAAQFLLGAGFIGMAWLANHGVLRLRRQEQCTARSEEETRTQAMVNDLVLESMSDGVLVVDQALRVQRANPAALALLDPGQELPPGGFSLHENPRWMPLVQIVSAAGAGTVGDLIEVALPGPGRVDRRLHVRTRRTAPTRTAPTGLEVIFLQDTEAQERWQQAERLAAMGQVARAIATEVQAPARAIARASQALARDMTDPAQAELNATMDAQAACLEALAASILGAAQPAPGERISRSLILDAEIRSLAEDWASRHDAAPTPQLELNSGRRKIHFPHAHLQRLLDTLLAHATAHAGESPAIVSTRATPDMRELILSVWFAETALADAVQAQLLRPFPDADGSGEWNLGLYVCQQLCTSMDAHISYREARHPLTGESGCGHAFVVTFKVVG